MSKYQTKALIRYGAGQVFMEFRIEQNGIIRTIQVKEKSKDVGNEWDQIIRSLRLQASREFMIGLSQTKKAQATAGKPVGMSYAEWVVKQGNFEVIDYYINYSQKNRNYQIKNYRGKKRVIIRNKRGQFTIGNGQPFRYERSSSLTKKV